LAIVSSSVNQSRIFNYTMNPFDIDSIATSHPQLPPFLNQFNIQSAKHAGDAFDPDAAAEAENTAMILQGLEST
jgi:hypothetical protein